MKTLNNYNTTKAVAYLILVAAILPTNVLAKSRSCDASYLVTNKTNGDKFVFGDFVSREKCGINENKCRRAARDRALNCMKAQWRERWNPGKPSTCRSDKIERYPSFDFKKDLETRACHRGWGKNNKAVLQLSGQTRGKNSACSGKTVLSSSYEVTPQMCASIVSKPPKRDTTKPSSATPLVIPPNNKRDSVSGLMFPSSMPAIRYPKGYKGCSANDKAKIQKSWALAHYMVWSSNNAMDWMKRNSKYRKEAWNHTFRNPATNDHINYAPRAWFGPLNGESFGEASGTISKLWNNRYRGKTFTVMCRNTNGRSGSHPCYTGNPGGNGRPSANHIVYGRINFCKKWFDNDDYLRARSVMHETLHWLTSPKGHAIRDTHTHCHGYSKCTTDKSYGRDKSHHLSNYDGGNRNTKKSQKRRRVDHRKRALRNNDNYAWFMHDLGRAAYTKNWPSGLPRLTQFPATGFNR